MSNPEEELLEFGYDIIIQAFEKQKTRFNQQINHLQMIIDHLMDENTFLQSENEKYHKLNKTLKLQHENTMSLLASNQIKLNYIQNTILDDNPMMHGLHRFQLNEGKVQDSFSTKINPLVNNESRNKSNDFENITDQSTIIKQQITKNFFEECSNELSIDIYERLLLLLQEYEEGKLKDSYVIKQTNKYLNGKERLLYLFDQLLLQGKVIE